MNIIDMQSNSDSFWNKILVYNNKKILCIHTSSDGVLYNQPIFMSSDVILAIVGTLGYNLKDSFNTRSRYFNSLKSVNCNGVSTWQT